MVKIANRISIGGLVFLIFLLTSSMGSGEVNVEKLIREVKEASNKIDSYKVNYVLKIKKEEGEVKSKGHIEYKEPKKFYMKIGLSELEGMKQIFVSDGEQIWQYIPKMGMVTKINLSKVNKEKASEYLDKRGDIREPFENLKRDSIEILKQTSGEKRKLYVIKAEPKNEVKKGTIVKVESVKIWIDSSRGIPNKILWYDSNENVVIKQVFEDIKLNPKIEDSKFEFTPPKGVRVMDVTDEVK